MIGLFARHILALNQEEASAMSKENRARPGNLWVTCGFQRWD